MRRYRSQAGGISILAGVALTVLCFVALASTYYGRLTIRRGEAQHAVDAAAVLALNVIRERGLPLDAERKLAAEQAGNVALGSAGEYSFYVDSSAAEIRVTVGVSVSVEGEGVFDQDHVVSAHATGTLDQQKIAEAERNLPKLVLVLDYSGSMNSRFVDGGKKVDALRSSVQRLLEADLAIEYGAVIFGDQVYEDIGVGADPADILEVLSRGPRGNTNAEAALLRASDLLHAQPDTGYYVLFVSDGAPNRPRSGILGFNNAGPNRGRDAAETLWSQGITIYSLEIRDRYQSDDFTDFMTDVSGNEEYPSDREFHYVASSTQDIGEVFEQVSAQIVCRAGPIEPGLDLSDVRVFLDLAGQERRLQPIEPGANIADTVEQRFAIEVETRTVQLSESACDLLLDEWASIVIRGGKPELVD